MLLFLIKKEISQNEDITLWSQKKNFEFLFADEKNLKGEQIDNKSKNKRKTVFTIFFSFQTMPKQLTLFGKISGPVEPYFKNPPKYLWTVRE